MAIRELNSVLAQNVDVDKATAFVAGMVIARDITTGLAIKADRATILGSAVVGLAADDKARTGVTMISVDPVGAAYIDPSTGAFKANNNGYYVAPKRALGDYYDETVTNISDLTSGATGYQGPRRGVGVFSTPSGQFVVDVSSVFNTGAAAAYATTSTTAESTGGTIVFATNDLLTYGSSNGAVGTTTDFAGKLVQLANAAHGKAVARVDKYDAGAGLLYITML